MEDGRHAGLIEAGEVLLEESRQQVPLDSGELMESGTVESDGESVSVSYNTPYAIRWHEEQANFQHGRKNKYLEDPANDPAVKARMMDILAHHIKF